MRRDGMAPSHRILTNATGCKRHEKTRKAREQTCRQGAFRGRKRPQPAGATEALSKNFFQFYFFRAIFALAGFVSALKLRRLAKFIALLCDCI